MRIPSSSAASKPEDTADEPRPRAVRPAYLIRLLESSGLVALLAIVGFVAGLWFTCYAENGEFGLPTIGLVGGVLWTVLLIGAVTYVPILLLALGASLTVPFFGRSFAPYDGVAFRAAGSVVAVVVVVSAYLLLAPWEPLLLLLAASNAPVGYLCAAVLWNLVTRELRLRGAPA